jgi:hypothetical protein
MLGNKSRLTIPGINAPQKVIILAKVWPPCYLVNVLVAQMDFSFPEV